MRSLFLLTGNANDAYYALCQICVFVKPFNIAFSLGFLEGFCALHVSQFWQVSRYTRRIHLYVCILGEDSRPRPVFQNFRQEELESMLSSNGDINKETAPQLLLDNSAFYEVFQAFVKEWNELRPIEQNKLHGKPLQLPLSLELCYLKDTINHGCGVCHLQALNYFVQLAICFVLIIFKRYDHFSDGWGKWEIMTWYMHLRSH